MMGRIRVPEEGIRRSDCTILIFWLSWVSGGGGQCLGPPLRTGGQNLLGQILSGLGHPDI